MLLNIQKERKHYVDTHAAQAPTTSSPAILLYNICCAATRHGQEKNFCTGSKNETFALIKRIFS